MREFVSTEGYVLELNGERFIDGYKEMFSIKFAGGEISVAEDIDAPSAYLVCDLRGNRPFTDTLYNNVFASYDYVDIMREFVNRLDHRCKIAEAEREERGLPLQCLSDEDCIPKSQHMSYEGQVVVVKPSELPPEERSAEYQLVLFTGTGDLQPENRNGLFSGITLYTGERFTYLLSSFAGIIAPERMPEWAREKLPHLQLQVEKELARNKQALQRDTGKRIRVEKT